MGSGKAYGKLILFGEHFVVHGLPSIIIPIDRYIQVKVSRGPSRVQPNLQHIINIAISELGVDEINIESIESNIPQSAGMGSSAALCVAILRAIADEYDLKLDDENMFRIATKMENVFHGKSSGVDVIMAIHHRPIIYQNSVYKPIDIKVNLGVKILPRYQSTGEIVENVFNFKEKHPKLFEHILDSYRMIYEEVLDFKTDYKRLGELMNINQSLLRSIGVSDNRVDKIITDMLESGALGAKISGAGRGGSIIALIDENSKYSYDILIKSSTDQ